MRLAGRQHPRLVDDDGGVSIDLDTAGLQAVCVKLNRRADERLVLLALNHTKSRRTAQAVLDHPVAFVPASNVVVQER